MIYLKFEFIYLLFIYLPMCVFGGVCVFKIVQSYNAIQVTLLIYYANMNILLWKLILFFLS